MNGTNVSTSVPTSVPVSVPTSIDQLTREWFDSVLDEQVTDAKHIEVVKLGLQSDGRFKLKRVLELLAERGVNELLVEAGAGLAGSFVEQSCADKLVVYVVLNDERVATELLKELNKLLAGKLNLLFKIYRL